MLDAVQIRRALPHRRHFLAHLVHVDLFEERPEDLHEHRVGAPFELSDFSHGPYSDLVDVVLLSLLVSDFVSDFASDFVSDFVSAFDSLLLSDVAAGFAA